MDFPRQLLSEIAGLGRLMGELFRLTERSADTTHQDHQHTHHKLDEWIQTNRALTQSNQELLKLITNNSEALTQLTTSYNNSVSSWQDWKQQPKFSDKTISSLSDGLIQRLLPALQKQGPQQAQQQNQNQQQSQNSEHQQQLATLIPLLQQWLQQRSEGNRSMPQLSTVSPAAQELSRSLSPKSLTGTLTIRERLNLSGEWIRQATVPLAVLGGLLLMAGSAVGYAYAQVRQPLYVVGNTLPLTLEEAELLSWARSGEGHFARNLMDWNSGALDSLHCTQDVKRLGVTLEVQGRPADYGFCTLWVVPPQKRRFLESS